MPIYGYRCSDCGHEIEVLQKVSGEPLKVCPNCQGKLVKKMYAAGVIFKGSGFYTTDYKGSGSKSASENGSSTSSEGKSESKSEAKPESKSAPKSESKSESSD